MGVVNSSANLQKELVCTGEKSAVRKFALVSTCHVMSVKHILPKFSAKFCSSFKLVAGYVYSVIL